MFVILPHKEKMVVTIINKGLQFTISVNRVEEFKYSNYNH